MSKDLDSELQRKLRVMWAGLWPTAKFTTPVAGYFVDFAGLGAGVGELNVGTQNGMLIDLDDRDNS